MDFSVFPSEYENKMRAESRNKIEQIKRQSDDRIRDFESKLTKRKPMPGICAVVVGAFYGACIGLSSEVFYVHLCVCLILRLILRRYF